MSQYCKGSQPINKHFLHTHHVACSAVGKFLVTASCNFKALRGAPHKQIFRMMHYKLKPGWILNYKYWIYPNHLPFSVNTMELPDISFFKCPLTNFINFFNVGS